MPHEVLEGSPHPVDMVTGRYRDSAAEEDLRMRQHLAQYRESVIDSAMLQNDLLGGSGLKVLEVIRGLYLKRLEYLASRDRQTQALEAILSALGYQVKGAPEQFHRILKQYLGPEIAIPFDPQGELYSEATAQGPMAPGGT